MLKVEVCTTAQFNKSYFVKVYFLVIYFQGFETRSVYIINIRSLINNTQTAHVFSYLISERKRGGNRNKVS